MWAKYLPYKFTIIIILLVASGLISSAHATSLFTEVDELLEKRLEVARRKRRFSVEGQQILFREGLSTFYQDRDYKPAWTDDFGPLPHTSHLIKTIQNAQREGLRPDDYWIRQIRKYLVMVRGNRTRQDLVQPPILVDMELLLTSAYLKYGSHMLRGKLDPTDFHPEWSVNTSVADLSTALQEAIDNNRVQSLLRNLRPPHNGYLALRKTLANYRRLAKKGGWPRVPEGLPLREGDRNPRVLALRGRLAVTSNLIGKKPLPSASDLFDADLKDSVIRFQKRHGLHADGIVGPATISILMIPVEERIRQIEINLERWRWLPRVLEKNHIRVDITDHKLHIVSNREVILTMGIIVGKPERQTPILTDQLTDVVFNPNWYIPPTILQKDILPKVQKNPDYLKDLKIRVFHTVDGVSREIDPNTIDWNNFEKEKTRYQFRQDSGPENFLGRYKFILSNDLDIYLHDTSFHAQFNGRLRNLSSGCVRLERPNEVAEYLLKGESGWNREKISTAVASGAPRKVTLSRPFPVYILYWTAWVDKDKTVNFPPDIYELDEAVAEALFNGGDR